MTSLKAAEAEKTRNVLCGTDRDVKFEGVVKPSAAAGFFSIGVLEAPKIESGVDQLVVTGKVPVIPGHQPIAH